ncbi:MAG: D-alanyl-D-alanine carboxypeptidase/D-alanyl-D-alanine-endopeptidase [Planctomycetota bacterium]
MAAVERVLDRTLRPVRGFSANAGCISAKVVPTSPGKEANVEVRPRGHGLKRIGTVNTTAKGSKIIVAVEARERGLTVRGSLPAGISGYETRFAYPDPVDLFGYGMLDSLARAGVAIEGGFERSRQVPAGREVARLRTPIVSAFLPILRDSNNSVADQLFLFLGHRYAGEGTRAGGARAVARALAGLGVDSDGWNQVDGSGLSKADRVRADQLTALLAGVFQRADADALALRQALPVAGESGTLRTRMRKGQAEGNVHAKTGWVEGASSLSGWAVTRGGRILIFSILINYPRHPNLNTSVFKPMQDEICEALASLR